MKRWKVFMLSTVLITVLLGMVACGDNTNPNNTEAPYEDETDKNVNYTGINGNTDKNGKFKSKYIIYSDPIDIAIDSSFSKTFIISVLNGIKINIPKNANTKLIINPENMLFFARSILFAPMFWPTNVLTTPPILIVGYKSSELILLPAPIPVII